MNGAKGSTCSSRFGGSADGAKANTTGSTKGQSQTINVCVHYIDATAQIYNIGSSHQVVPDVWQSLAAQRCHNKCMYLSFVA
jgi:hypothetical protein